MITVKTDPEGAVLYVNDVKAKALSPTVVDDIPVGLDIVIRIEKQGYFPYEENIGKVPAKVNKEISIILKPMKNAPAIPLQTNRKAEKNKPSVNAKEQAFISINSRPWANVYINGKLVKATPIIKHSLPAGSYKIQFKNPKFNIDKTFPVDLKPGEHQRMIKNFD